MESLSHAGTVVHVSAPEEGENTWTVQQVEMAHNLPPSDTMSRKTIDWAFGPYKMFGYVDSDTFEIGLSESVLGISLGNTFGNLKDGVNTKIDMLCLKGQTRKYLKNGNEVWIHLDLKVTFNGSYEGDYKILTI